MRQPVSLLWVGALLCTLGQWSAFRCLGTYFRIFLLFIFCFQFSMIIFLIDLLIILLLL